MEVSVQRGPPYSLAADTLHLELRYLDLVQNGPKHADVILKQPLVTDPTIVMIHAATGGDSLYSGVRLNSNYGVKNKINEHFSIKTKKVKTKFRRRKKYDCLSFSTKEFIKIKF